MDFVSAVKSQYREKLELHKFILFHKYLKVFKGILKVLTLIIIIKIPLFAFHITFCLYGTLFFYICIF